MCLKSIEILTKTYEKYKLKKKKNLENTTYIFQKIKNSYISGNLTF